MKKNDFQTYVSPFSNRYGSYEMRHLFSQEYKFQTWRKIWLAIAKAQYSAGLLSKKEIDDLEHNRDNLDIKRIYELENETKHDVVAALREYAEKTKIGGGKIHFGATSMDIVDNQESIVVIQAIRLIEEKLIDILEIFAKKINEYADLTCMGYTHLQAAEPTTLGYRFSFYAQDLLIDLRFLRFTTSVYKAKGLKGAVGNSASYKAILEETSESTLEFEDKVMKTLGLSPILISSQVNTRKFDYLILSLLASISSSLAKFAADVRILQSSGFGELQEPFASTQVGSSAMPFKKNPITCEKICSLARYVSSLPMVALSNASLSYLERTLDDSANKRIITAEAMLSVDEILECTKKVLTGIIVYKDKIAFNLSQYSPFSSSESIIIAAVKKGANRQKMHEVLRNISMIAWNDVQKGKKNPFQDLLMEDKVVIRYLDKTEISKLLNVSTHIGDASSRSKKLVNEIRKTLHEK